MTAIVPLGLFGIGNTYMGALLSVGGADGEGFQSLFARVINSNTGAITASGAFIALPGGDLDLTMKGAAGILHISQYSNAASALNDLVGMLSANGLVSGQVDPTQYDFDTALNIPAPTLGAPPYRTLIRPTWPYLIAWTRTTTMGGFFRALGEGRGPSGLTAQVQDTFFIPV